jgi:hypothetical protein
MVKRVERMEGRGIVSHENERSWSNHGVAAAAADHYERSTCWACGLSSLLLTCACGLCSSRPGLSDTFPYWNIGVRRSWRIYEWFCCCSGALLMPMCCQTASIGLSLLIFCHCHAFSAELENSLGGPLCALPPCNSSHEWRCLKFTCDFAYSVAWRPRTFFRPAWQYLCLAWCQIFSPLKLCTVRSSTDLYIKKQTTCVLVAASVDPHLGWKFLWIYTGVYPSRCMPPPPRGVTWHVTIRSWTQTRLVTSTKWVNRRSQLQCNQCKHPAHFDHA